jgi:SAM-dependent methyltransferase
MPALERLLFLRLKPGSPVLDVCCGCGHVTEELVRRGYVVTGIDISAELIGIARERVPGAQFQIADVTQFAMDSKFEAALSTFDALNHILTIEELEKAFRNVRQVLVPGGLFVFDMNLEEAFFADLRQWHASVRDRDVSLIRGNYDLTTNLARTELIWFVRTADPDLWRRQTADVYERCYSESQITDALYRAGWTNVKCETARNAGIESDLGFGRLFFSARRPTGAASG